MRLNSSIACVLVCLAAACGGPLKYNPTSTAKAPGAKAELVAEVNQKQNNTRVDLEIEHLAPPAAVQPGTRVYVVWQRKGSDKAWTRIGSLDYDESSRKGHLKAVSVPETAFDLEISAEESTEVASPSGGVVFEQSVNKS